MQSRKTNVKISQFKHQHTEIFTLSKNHSRHLSKYNGWRKKDIDRKQCYENGIIFHRPLHFLFTFACL